MNPPPTSKNSSPLGKPAPPALRPALAALLLVVLAGCGTTVPVGPTPGATVAPATPTSSPSISALKVDISIDSSTVIPNGKQFTIERGRSVLITTKSDHDVTLTIQGAGIDKKVFIGRLSTILTTFVVRQAGTVTIKSSSPAATIATLDIS